MSRASTLKIRAKFLALTRNFFSIRNVLEVDPGALVKCPPNDSNIDCIATDQDGNYLHTSPEYAMKRLLAEGIGDIFFLGHVYRKNEKGSKHNPEFTMLEWYRIDISFKAMIQETCELLFLFLGPLPIQFLSHHEAFRQWAHIDYHSIALAELQIITKSNWDKKTCLDYLLTHKIEPNLGLNHLTVLIDFPPDEAALACTTLKNNQLVAERYEIYYQGVELCNGYHELSDAKELRHRFEQKNIERQAAGKESYPIDEMLLEAVEKLPDCCGVALGFDRALMLHTHAPSIKEVIPLL